MTMVGLYEAAEILNVSSSASAKKKKNRNQVRIKKIYLFYAVSINFTFNRYVYFFNSVDYLSLNSTKIIVIKCLTI
jgi:hypothetical protein